ncbi:MAG TPA: flagellar biosynthetic protein FliO [Turneriella sp.]|nr:flagellar biosynthetic protein FliO [Turneriella sp.]
MRTLPLICLALISVAPFTLVAQAENPAKEAATKSTESSPKNTERRDTLDDFEKQLQKELEGSPDRPANGGEQPSVFWQFIRTLITLAFLLGIFYAIFRLYKFKRELPAQNFSAVTSIYEYPLGTNQRLQIIEIAGKLMILGVSDNSIQLISEVTDKYTIDRIKLDCAEDNTQPRADFLAELSRAIKTNLKERFGKKTGSQFSTSVIPGPEDLESQRQSSLERLRKLKSEKFDWRDKA